MEVNIGTYSDTEVASTTQQKDFKLAEGSATMIFQIFSKKIYSNPIGSVVREITSNCQDSHIEAGVSTPVLIRKTVNHETREYYISFIDFGVGMSPERIDNIFTTFFESTKRKDNSQIGGFGLGSKTPLTYRRYINKYNSVGEYDNSYQIITNFDGTKYTYVIHEGKSAPQITLMDSQPTKERNGTEVRIPVLYDDIDSFENEIINQLYYFENLIFEGFEDTDVENEYTIYEGENFFFRGEDVSDYMHVSLGRVAYPIDFKLIDEDKESCRVPVALKFDVGDLEVVVSREHLDYTPETVKRIKAKIKLAKDELKKRLEADLTGITTLEDFLTQDFNFFKTTIGDKKIDLGCYLNAGDVTLSNFPYNDILNRKKDIQIFNLLVDKKMYGAKEPTYYGYSEGVYKNNLTILKSSDNVYFHEGEFERVVKKQSYLKMSHKRYYIITKSDLSELNTGDAKIILSINIDDNVLALLEKLQNDWFEIVKKYSKNYEEIVVPEGVGMRGKKYDKSLLDVTLPIGLVRYSHVARERVNLGHLASLNQRKFYGFSEDRDALLKANDAVAKFFDGAPSIVDYRKDGLTFNKKSKCIYFFLISRGNEKHFKELPNTHHVSEFQRIMLNRKMDNFANIKLYGDFKTRMEDVWNVFRSKRFLENNPTHKKYADSIAKFLQTIKPTHFDAYDYSNVARNYNIELDGIDSWEKKLNDYYVRRMEKLDVLNKDVVEFVRVPYDMGGNDAFWKFIEKNIIVQ